MWTNGLKNPVGPPIEPVVGNLGMPLHPTERARLFKQVPSRPGLVAGEHEVLEFWESSQAFDKLRAKNEGKPRWSFLDGPITANGFMGVHHAWGRTYKDAFQRYFAMPATSCAGRTGFDCQGLWVEVQVENELGFKSKRDIEEYGIEEFIERCKERVWKYSAIQTRQSIRLGMWSDWDNSYFTMSDENNYTIWSFLKRCHERGLIYKGLDAMPWCPRCGTGISEQETQRGLQGSVTDTAVYRRNSLCPTDPVSPVDLDHHSVDAGGQRRRRGQPGADIRQGAGRR